MTEGFLHCLCTLPLQHFPATSALPICTLLRGVYYFVCARSCINSCCQSVLALKSLFLNYDAKGSSKKNGKGKSE